jgi:ABC-type branched-subunit amino acid transport system ATPase component
MKGSVNMTDNNIPLKLTQEITLQGVNPVVLIGPNGSGKTRFGATIANQQNAEFIGALRNISLEDDIPMQPLERAGQELRHRIRDHRSRYWSLSNEINYLFSKLLAEDATSAMKLRDSLRAKKQTEIENTKFMQLRDIWCELFPGREIKFDTYSPKVESRFTSTPIVYAAKQMSDGERVALYLGARVLDAKSGLIVVDEPEVHFHSRLAVRFWNIMQNLRPDLRFIYLTHDLSFALSRQNAHFVIIRPNLDPEVVPLVGDIPKELAESILGAASFSIFADRIVFCEGDENTDYSFYTSWFNTPHTVIIPVGGCKDVLDCANAFCSHNIVSGVDAIGIVDRDYWPEQYFNKFPAYVTPLPVHELENIYCLPGLFKAIGQYLSIANIDSLYDDFIAQAKARFKEELLAKQVLERFKCRCGGGLNTVLNDLHVIADLDALQSQCVNILQPRNWGFNPDTIFRDERKLLENALASTDPMQFLIHFPGKVFLPIAAKSLGIEPSRYRELVNKALVADDNSGPSGFKKSIESVLADYLPPR